MKIKILIKTGLAAGLVSGIILSCNRTGDNSKNQSEPNEIARSVHDDITKEISDLRYEAELVIAEFNNKTFEIRREALKNKKNIDAEIKQKIIDIEKQVIELEEKLEDLNSQPVKTWTDFSKSMKNDLTDMKRNIENLTSKNSV